jgi:hypothetical protein
MGSASRFISGLVAEEIRRIVAVAARDGRLLSASDTAASILQIYPKCGFDEAEIANEVMLRAANAGIGVLIGRQAKGLDPSQVPPSLRRSRSDRLETL